MFLKSVPKEFLIYVKVKQNGFLNIFFLCTTGSIHKYLRIYILDNNSYLSFSCFIHSIQFIQYFYICVNNYKPLIVS